MTYTARSEKKCVPVMRRKSIIKPRMFLIAATVASSVFLIIYVILAFLVPNVSDMNSQFLVDLSCLTPLGALYQGFTRIRYFEVQGKGEAWSLGSRHCCVHFFFSNAYWFTFFDRYRFRLVEINVGR